MQTKKSQQKVKKIVYTDKTDENICDESEDESNIGDEDNESNTVVQQLNSTQEKLETIV